MKKLLVALLSLGLFACGSKQNEERSIPADAEIIEASVVEAEPVEYLFDIPLTDFEVVDDHIRRGENLGAILNRYFVDFATIDKVAKKSKEVFDVRRLRQDKPYKVICSKDSVLRAQYFIYQDSPIDFVVFDLRDSVRVYKQQRPVTIKTETAVGEIESSLYESLVNANLSPAIAVEMNAIYAWTIDFFRLQKGDRFKLIYEAKYVDNEFVGIGLIKAASFEHMGKEFNAYYYEENELFGDYFDEEGNSLRRAFLKAPVNYTRISSRYSGKRYHPVLKRYKAHLGTDYAAPTGTPIYATANGVITEARYKRNNGNYVKIRHNSTYTTQYLHMSKIKSGIRPGVAVQQGDVIGYVGSTGLATGPHVCYRFWKNGVQVDPYKQDLPAAEPIEASKMPAYLKSIEQIKEKLATLPYPGEELAFDLDHSEAQLLTVQPSFSSGL